MDRIHENNGHFGARSKNKKCEVCGGNIHDRKSVERLRESVHILKKAEKMRV